MLIRKLVKVLFVVICFFSTEAAFAVNKCVVDGKTIYQQSPCPKDTGRAFVSKGISEVNSDGLRNEIAIRKALEEEEREKIANLYQKKRGLNMAGQQNQQMNMQAQQMHMQSQMNRLEGQMQLQQIQQNMNQLMR